MIRVFGKKYSIRKLFFFSGEGFFLFFSLVVVVAYRNVGDISASDILSLWPRLLIIVFVCLLSLYYYDLYTFRSGFNYVEMSIRLIQALGSASIFLGFLYFVFPVLLPGRWVFLGSLLVFIFLSSLWRYAYCWMLRKEWWTIPVLIVGSGTFSEEIIREIKDKSDCGFSVAGAVLDKVPAEDEAYGEIRVFNSFSDLSQRVRETGAEEIIVAMDQRRGRLPLNQLLECKMKGVPVLEGETFYEELTGRISVDKINPSWLIFQEGFQKSWLMIATKRLIGTCLSALGLFFSFPIILLTSICIKLDSRGPIFYRQERVGRDGKTFVLIKFRSMRQDAERGGAKWAKQDDVRVTRVGSIIRKLRIDEIPQMWNVLKGEMNFVGPRPERPEFVSELTEKIRYYDQRGTVQPGITGWAQISYPYGASEEDAKKKLEYDLFYIKHMSIVLDLYIILKTVKTILFREGSR
ncbi:MAG: TIGR03013 family PEP-CTERM/XrtA system glycosyltransferase [Deltaproteobacteria bacterium]|nr:TIGR03013 family PEP-CTERM/XrtA system glycosyltransferase [Deltaproteobacteria bacterium]